MLDYCLKRQVWGSKIANKKKTAKVYKIFDAEPDEHIQVTPPQKAYEELWSALSMEKLCRVPRV